MHQLSPYIGKLKSSIARELIIRFSRRGDLIVDPFAGSGTIPLEGILLGRHVFASDVSPYSAALVKAKITPPRTEKSALQRAEKALARAADMPDPNLSQVPPWVRHFFHPRTLKEILRFVDICHSGREHFLLGCLLGILHHQRPGFLSYPSSHLVPYLRNKSFPRDHYPEMYKYRALRPRLIAKVKRSYRRYLPPPEGCRAHFRRGDVATLTLPLSFDCLITSPPYMNALDYSRDNRLRIWFLDRSRVRYNGSDAPQGKEAFVRAIRALARTLNSGLRHRGYCVFVVGEDIARHGTGHPAEILTLVLKEEAPMLVPVLTLSDTIPDIRRSRRALRGTKRELILAFRRG